MKYDNPSVPYWDHGDTITAEASGLVNGRRFVTIAGPRNVDGNPVVRLAAAGDPIFGVSAYEALDGDKLTIHHAAAIVVQVEAGAAIVAGNPVKSDATGRAIPQAGAGTIVGYALDTASAAGQLLPVDRSTH